MPGRTRTAERHVRALAAALAAVVGLLLAGNTGPTATAQSPAPHPAQAPVRDAGPDLEPLVDTADRDTAG